MKRKKSSLLSEIDPLFAQSFDIRPRKGDLMKFKIIEKAIPIMAQNGLNANVYELLAKDLQVRRSHIVYYFPEKESLFLSAIRYVLAKAQAVTVESISANQTPRQSLQSIIESAFRWAKEYPEQAQVFLLFHYLSTVSSEISIAQIEFRKTAQERIQALCHDADRAQAIHALIMGKLAEALTYSKNPKDLTQQLKLQAEKTVRFCVELGGLF